MELVYIGTIVNPRGYKGEMKLDDVMVNCPVIPVNTEVYVGYSPNFSQKYYVESWANNKKLSYIKLTNIDSEELVLELKEKGIFIDELILDDLYSSEEDKPIISTGIKVYDNANDKYLGEVLEIWEMPANNIWYVQTENGRLPVPANNEIIAEYDRENNTAKINVLDGLLDLLEKDD